MQSFVQVPPDNCYYTSASSFRPARFYRKRRQILQRISLKGWVEGHFAFPVLMFFASSAVFRLCREHPGARIWAVYPSGIFSRMRKLQVQISHPLTTVPDGSGHKMKLRGRPELLHRGGYMINEFNDNI